MQSEPLVEDERLGRLTEMALDPVADQPVGKDHRLAQRPRLVHQRSEIGDDVVAVEQAEMGRLLVRAVARMQRGREVEVLLEQWRELQQVRIAGRRVVVLAALRIVMRRSPQHLRACTGSTRRIHRHRLLRRQQDVQPRPADDMDLLPAELQVLPLQQPPLEPFARNQHMLQPVADAFAVCVLAQEVVLVGDPVRHHHVGRHPDEQREVQAARRALPDGGRVLLGRQVFRDRAQDLLLDGRIVLARGVHEVDARRRVGRAGLALIVCHHRLLQKPVPASSWQG